MKRFLLAFFSFLFLSEAGKASLLAEDLLPQGMVPFAAISQPSSFSSLPLQGSVPLSWGKMKSQEALSLLSQGAPEFALSLPSLSKADLFGSPTAKNMLLDFVPSSFRMYVLQILLGLRDNFWEGLSALIGKTRLFDSSEQDRALNKDFFPLTYNNTLPAQGITLPSEKPQEISFHKKASSTMDIEQDLTQEASLVHKYSEGSSPTQSQTFQSLQNDKGFNRLPNALILKVADFLGGEDFHNFALANKTIKKLVMNHQGFFMPSEDKEIIETLKATPFVKLDLLALKWSRKDKSFLFKKMSGLALNFSRHNHDFWERYGQDFSPEEYEERMLNFEMSLKCSLMNFFVNPSLEEQKLAGLKDSKIRGFLFDHPELGNHPNILQLIVTQAVIVSSSILENLDRYYTSEFMKEIKIEAIKRQQAFALVTKILEQFEVPTEKYLYFK